MLLYFFHFPLIRYNTRVVALRGLFVFSTLLLDVQLMVSDELRCWLSVLGPLNIVVLLRLLMQQNDCIVDNITCLRSATLAPCFLPTVPLALPSFAS